MKYLIIVLTLFTVANTFLAAQQGIPFKSLTVGNRFVYKYFSEDRAISPRDTVYRYYEDVLRDTMINDRRYAIVFSSFDSSLRYERSDGSNLYVWRNGREEIWHSWNFQENDTTRFAFLAFNQNSASSFNVSRIRKTLNPFTGDTTGGYNINFNWGGLADDRTIITCVQKRGLTQVDFYRNVRNFTTLVVGRWFQGGIIDGVVVQDTSTRNTIVSVNGSETPISRGVAALSQPNPFSESVSLTYTLPTPAQDVELRVYSTSGALFASLRTGAQASGKHSIEWNGKAADGTDVPAGTYFVALFIEGRKQSEAKMVRVK